MGLFDKIGDFFGDVGGWLTGSTAVKKANKANEARYQMGLNLIKDYDPLQAQLFGLARQGFRDVAQQLGEGYDRALRSVSDVGRANTQRLLDLQRQRVAEADQVLAGRGLYDTTAALGARRGIGYDTNLALGQVNQGFAGLLGNLYGQKAQATASPMMALAQSWLAQEQARRGLLNTQLNWIFNRADRATGKSGLDLIGDAASVATKLIGLF